MVDTTKTLIARLVSRTFVDDSERYYSYTGKFWKMWHMMVFAYGPRAWGKLREMGCPESDTSEDKVKAGVKLVEAITRGVNITELPISHLEAWEVSGKNNPLNLACALMRGGIEDGRQEAGRIFNELHGNKWAAFTNVGGDHGFFQIKGRVNPTSPEMFNVQPYSYSLEEYHHGLAQLSWFTEDYARHMLSKYCEHYSANLALLHAMSLRFGDRWRKQVETLAAKLLRKDLSAMRPQPEYKTLALALQLAPPSVSRRYLNEVRGVREALGVVYVDDIIDTNIFRKGVKALAKEVPRKELGGFVAQPIHVKDIDRLAPASIVRILSNLPWDVVKPVVTKHKDRLLSKCSIILDDPDLLDSIRMCWTDHDRRMKSYEYSHHQGLGDPDDEQGSPWAQQMLPIATCYNESRTFRNELFEAGLTEDHQLLLLMLQLKPDDGFVNQQEIVNMWEEVKTFPIWRALETFLDRTPTHLVE